MGARRGPCHKTRKLCRVCKFQPSSQRCGVKKCLNCKWKKQNDISYGNKVFLTPHDIPRILIGSKGRTTPSSLWSCMICVSLEWMNTLNIWPCLVPTLTNPPVIWSTEAWVTCTNLQIMQLSMMSLKLSDSKKDVHKRCFIHQKQGTWSNHHRFTNSFSQRLGEMNTLTWITQNTPPLRHG